MSFSDGKAPVVISDLRNGFPEARDQGSRPLCLVFALSDLNAFLHRSGKPLSIEYLTYHAYEISGSTDYSQGLACESVLAALELKGQPIESDFPYDPQALMPTRPPHEQFQLFKAKGTERATNTAAIKNYLDNGVPIGLGVILPQEFFMPSPPYVFDESTGMVGRHALLAVGYGKLESGELAFLVRNSWGTGWADSGYAWITEAFVRRRVELLIEVEK